MSRPRPSFARMSSSRMSSGLVRGALVGLAAAAALTMTLLPAPPARATDGGLDQTVTADEAVAEGRAVVDAGHVDIGPHRDPATGEWEVLARDDSGETPVWRHLDDLVLRVRDAALLDAPTDAAFDFMGEREGARWYVIPQVEAPGVVWLGWNTQDPGVKADMERGVTMRVWPGEGPGRRVLFLQDGAFGAPLVLADSAAGVAQDAWVDVNTHVHANWVFTEPGVHLVPVTFSGTTRDGGERSASAVIRFAVGDSVSDAEAFEAPAPTVLMNEGRTTGADGSGESAASGAASASSAEGSARVTGESTGAAGAEDARGGVAGLAAALGVPVGLVWGVLAAAVAFVAAGVLWWRQRSTARDIAAARASVRQEGEAR